MQNQIKTILYASDLGSETEPVFSITVDLAEKYGANIVFLHVIEPINQDTLFWIGGDVWQEIKEQTYENAQEMITERIDRYFTQYIPENTPIKQPTVKIVYDYIPKAILSIAEEENIDLIIMGSHTHSTLGKLLLGSTADKVIQLSKTPILLMPIKD